MLQTPRALARLAAATGFEASSLEKVDRLGQVLSAIAAEPTLASSLVLKGGTALNLFSGTSPRRLSVDLDFNYVGCLAREAMEEARPAFEARLNSIAWALGYRTQQSKPAHAGHKLFLSYRRNVDGLLDRVEVDVNYLHRLPLLPTTRRRMWQPTGDPGVEFELLDFEELAAGKLAALLDRRAARDLWDTANLMRLSGGSWPSEKTRVLLLAYCGALPRALPDYARRPLGALSMDSLALQLYPLLIAGDEPRIEELVAAASTTIDPLLHLTPREIEFCDRLQKGDLMPELICPADPLLAQRIASSPVLLWKVQNARRKGRW